MLNKLLSDGRIVKCVLTIDEIISLRNSARIMMGQTFDNGQPLDMMKYAFYVMALQYSLNEKGVRSDSVWILADHFIRDINQESEAEVVIKQSE